MTDRMLDYDSRDIALKKKYVKEFSKVLLPATTVAKFFQLDHRIDLLMGMQVESSLPTLAFTEGRTAEGGATKYRVAQC